MVRIITLFATVIFFIAGCKPREKVDEDSLAKKEYVAGRNPVARLTLDHHIQSFDISPDGKGIYAFDREITNEIFYYDWHNIVK